MLLKMIKNDYCLRTEKSNFTLFTIRSALCSFKLFLKGFFIYYFKTCQSKFDIYNNNLFCTFMYKKLVTFSKSTKIDYWNQLIITFHNHGIKVFSKNSLFDYISLPHSKYLGKKKCSLIVYTFKLTALGFI